MAGLTPTSSRTSRRALAWLPIIALTVFIVAPQVAMVAYAMFTSGEFTVSAFTGLIGNNAFYSALTLSFVISLATVVLLVVVLVPAVVAVHLWAPKLSGLLSTLCTLPLVIPAIALVAGLLQILRTMASTGRGSPLNVLSASLQNSDFPIALIGTYVVLSLPFTYRSVNAALGTIPLRVYFEASASLGAGTWTTLARIILPNIRGSILFSAFFAFALGFSEYTVAATMSVRTLPVYMTTLSSTDFRASIALSLLSNVITWGLLAVSMIYAERAGKKSTSRKIKRRRARSQDSPGSDKAQSATPGPDTADNISNSARNLDEKEKTSRGIV